MLYKGDVITKKYIKRKLE